MKGMNEQFFLLIFNFESGKGESEAVVVIAARAGSASSVPCSSGLGMEEPRTSLKDYPLTHLAGE